MGVADLRDAFNSVSQPAFTCARATMSMSRANDTEWQILVFRGTGADGTEFAIQADRAPASADGLQVARVTAQRLIDQRAKT